MSPATGLGIIETGLLETCDRGGAVPGAPYVKCQRLLQTLHETHGIAPRIGYQVLCDLARPRVSRLRLLDFHGNYGSTDFSPASPKYTGARLTPLGAAALGAERGQLGALPIGLINGTTHVDGAWPPLDAAGVVAALLAARSVDDDAALVAMIGLPRFPTGCHVDADLARFASGEETTLRLRADVAVDGRQLVISHLPPGVSATEIFEALRDFTTRSGDGVLDVNDHTTGEGTTRVVVRLSDHTDTNEFVRELGELWGLRTTLNVALGRPLAAIVRDWTDRFAGDDLAERLALIEQTAT